MEAPSVSGVELAAVMVASSPSWRPNAGFRPASFSGVESGRRLLSRARPWNGVTRSSMYPAAYAAPRFRWEAAASSSWA